MKRRLKNAFPALAAVGAFLAGSAISVGTGYAAHTTPIQLKNFDEVSMQLAGPAKTAPGAFDSKGNAVPNVSVPIKLMNTTSRQGFPYSPKATCGTSGCHDYENISKHAFHAGLGKEQWVDTADGNLTLQVKPWMQGMGMYGKW